MVTFDRLRAVFFGLKVVNGGALGCQCGKRTYRIGKRTYRIGKRTYLSGAKKHDLSQVDLIEGGNADQVIREPWCVEEGERRKDRGERWKEEV